MSTDTGSAPTPGAAAETGQPGENSSSTPDLAATGTTGSPSGDTAPAGAAADTLTGAAADDAAAAAPEPTAEELARARVPTGDEAYAYTPPEGLDRYIPAGDKDPAVVALMAGAKEQGWSQGRIDDVFAGLKILTDKGVIAPPFDAAAETTALGDGGAQLQQDQLTFLESLKARGEIDDGMFGELASLVPTASGTKALAFMRKQMTQANGNIDTGAPSGGTPGKGEKSEAQKEADALHQDPRYQKDFRFKRDADAKFRAAYGD